LTLLEGTRFDNADRGLLPIVNWVMGIQISHALSASFLITELHHDKKRFHFDR